MYLTAKTQEDEPCKKEQRQPACMLHINDCSSMSLMAQMSESLLIVSGYLQLQLLLAAASCAARNTSGWSNS
jgi:hypothetical protein